MPTPLVLAAAAFLFIMLWRVRPVIPGRRRVSRERFVGPRNGLFAAQESKQQRCPVERRVVSIRRTGHGIMARC